MGEESEDLRVKATAVSDCMLSQYFGTAVGLGLGLAVGIQKKSLRPFVIAVTAGTLGDWILGYTGPCRPMIQEYQAAKKAFNDQQKQEK